MNRFFILLICALMVGAVPSFGQKKTTTSGKKKTTTTTTKQSGNKKTTTSGQKQTTKDPKKGDAGKKGTGETKASDLTSAAGAIDPSKADTFRLQVTPLVKFFESSLNFLGDKRNEVSDMQVIITTSYLKWCWDEHVQIEDDLDENRIVPLYKDMPAYLADVDFFFKGAKFQYTIQDISLETNPVGLTYFKVTANRNLKGLTINGDSVNSNKVRYIEINYDSIKQQLKIVSVYTTKLNEKEDMRNWWNSLTPEWKSILAADMKLEGTMPMSSIESFNDSLAVIGGQKKAIMGSEFYRFLDQIIGAEKLDIQGRKNLTDLTPVNRLSELKEINISGTGVADLSPIRNMNKLEILDLSHTAVTSLEPLKYCIRINQLRMRGTKVSDIGVLTSFPSLTLLDMGGTKIQSLDDLQELTQIRDLRINQTAVSDLSPIAGMTKMEMLNLSGTSVEDIGVTRNFRELKILMCDSTGISSITPLDSLTRLQRVYCNNTRIGQKQALNFLKKHPDASLVYASKPLELWWKNMSPVWQDQFNFYMTLNNPPTTEQLHKLVLLDSINITGRSAITNLEPLSKLILLRSLYCPTTGITSLEPLKDLTELKVINVSNTKITSLAPLAQTENLEILYLDNTPVSDLNPLLELKKLRFVFADNTGVNDDQADKFAGKKPGCLLVYQTYENQDWWGKLSKAWKEVLLDQVKIKGEPDKNQLQIIAGLNTVTINENFQIGDITPLTHLTRLKELQVSGTTVASLEPVTRIPGLEVLRCMKNPISDLTPVTGLPNLKELDFSNTQVEDLDPLQNKIRMEILKFNGTQVKNLKYLQKLVNLKVLEFYNTRVGNIDVLDGMTRLESVKMFNTKVSAKKVEKLRQLRPRCEIIYY